MFGAFLISRGKLFYKIGGATIKDLSPNVLYVLKLTHLSKIPFELERNLYLPSFLILISSVIYPRAKPLRALNIKSKILNYMRNVTGSQTECKLYNSGVILRYLDSLYINLTAAFWTLSILCI